MLGLLGTVWSLETDQETVPGSDFASLSRSEQMLRQLYGRSVRQVHACGAVDEDGVRGGKKEAKLLADGKVEFQGEKLNAWKFVRAATGRKTVPSSVVKKLIFVDDPKEGEISVEAYQLAHQEE